MPFCWAHRGLKTLKGANRFFNDFSVIWASKSRVLAYFGLPYRPKLLAKSWKIPKITENGRNDRNSVGDHQIWTKYDDPPPNFDHFGHFRPFSGFCLEKILPGSSRSGNMVSFGDKRVICNIFGLLRPPRCQETSGASCRRHPRSFLA